MIKTPDEFKKICRNMVPGITNFSKSEEEFVALTLLGVSKQDASIVAPFLESILARQSPQVLKEWMWSMPGSLGFTDADQLIRYLKLLLVKLQSPPLAP
jgi:hypothetical protein